MIQCRSIWKIQFSIKSIQEVEIWFEQIVHEVEIASYDNSMSDFQKEIEI